VRPEAISAADVDARLGPRGRGVRELFERADRWTYAGGRALPPDELERWRRTARHELETWKEVA
jgi:hypothetical protein